MMFGEANIDVVATVAAGVIGDINSYNYCFQNSKIAAAALEL